MIILPLVMCIFIIVMSVKAFVDGENQTLLSVVTGDGLYARRHISDWAIMDHMVTPEPRNINLYMDDRKAAP